MRRVPSAQRAEYGFSGLEASQLFQLRSTNSEQIAWQFFPVLVAIPRRNTPGRLVAIMLIDPLLQQGVSDRQHDRTDEQTDDAECD